MKTLIKSAFTSWPACIATYITLAGFVTMIVVNGRDIIASIRSSLGL